MIRRDMADVTVREWRNDGGRVLTRVERGESLTVTRYGHAIAATTNEERAARACGRAALALRRRGRAVKPRAYDVMIAATALANGLPLYTCNPKDFAGIDGLTVVAVPVPGGHEREPKASRKPRAKR